MSDQLYFPTGLSVARVKKDAKKRAKAEGIKLSEALDRIARQNSNYAWDWAFAMAAPPGAQEILAKAREGHIKRHLSQIEWVAEDPEERMAQQSTTEQIMCGFALGHWDKVKNWTVSILKICKIHISKTYRISHVRTQYHLNFR